MFRKAFGAVLAVAALAVSPRLLAQFDEEQRVRESMLIVSEIMSAADSAIPTSVLARAEGIAVFPGSRSDGFVSGNRLGGGILSARVRSARGWSAPAFMMLSSGTGRGQIGAQADDVVLVIMNRRSLESVVNKNVTTIAGSGVVPGPIGRDVPVTTAAQKESDILSYSRSQDGFAGVNLNGASIRADPDANRRFYGKRLRTADVVSRGMAGGTGLVSDWKSLLARYAQ